MKHKVFFLRQLASNNITSNILKFIIDYYGQGKVPKESYVAQLRAVEACVNIKSNGQNSNEMIAAIHEKFKCLNEGLVETIRFRFFLMSQTTYYDEQVEIMKQITNSLYVNFYPT
jgi:uncharacterized protein YfkK (UPF0435 family)